MDKREMRALTITATTRLQPDNGCWKVPSQTGEGSYKVVVTNAGSWSCTCPDHEERLADCKHILAVEITAQREAGKQKVTYTEMVKVTYSQNWSAYNAAQTGEKEMFLRLLAELCSTIPQPPQAIGRPRLLLSDMAFAVVSKVYACFSARRFASDLRTAEAAGLVDKAPSFNSVLRYMRAPEINAALSHLVEVSSLPLKAVETDFAADSTGFGTSQMRSWYSQKHGRVIEGRDWRKVHAMAGTRTHIVTAVEVGPYASGDAPYLPGLAATTAANFQLREVSADKGYLTKNNAAAIERLGATPYIPFKSNSVEPVESTAWARMYHLFAYRRDEFLEHYHKRSNVETVFAMMKAKFGDNLLSKTEDAQVNEVLGKVIAHNLCVLIQSFYELGIEPTFGAASAPAPELHSKVAF
ncbi:MAG: transposase [Actinomycetota bacterium]|nr:transposase [Actinomycetota bacterium]